MSPNPKARNSSATSVLRVNSTGIAFRRGDLKISDPIPIPREGDDGFGPQALPMHTDTWPRQSSNSALDGFNANGPEPQPASDTRVSSYNMTPSLSTGPSKGSLNKSRSSSGGGFKAAMRKMFGSKKKRDTITSIAEEPPRREALSFITSAEPALEASNPQHQRSGSVALQDLTRYSALGSHAPGIFDTPEAFDGQNNGSNQGSWMSAYQQHKRRNTLSDSRGVGELKVPAESTPLQHKRRSRSAGQLREAATVQSRSRDDEIMYWRRSTAEDPILIHGASRPTTRGQSTAGPSEDYALPTIDQSPIVNHGKTLHIMPSQTFDFGNLMGFNTEDSVEERLTTLEVKFIDLESAVARLSGVDKPIVLGKPPHRHVSNPSAHSNFQHAPSTTNHQPHEPTYIASPQQPEYVPNEEEGPAQNHRSSAAMTLRPSTAIRRSEDQNAVLSPTQPTYATVEHIEKLMILIQREQSRRQELEVKCKTLESLIEQMQRSPPYAHFKANAYPTPSPEETSLASKRRQGSAGGSISSNAPRLGGGGGPGSSKYRDDISVATDDEDGFLDVYETPTETKEQRFGIEPMRSQQYVAGMI